MKSPRRLATLIALLGFLVPVTAAKVAAAKAKPAKAQTNKKNAKGKTDAKADSLRKADSLAKVRQALLADSAKADSVLRAERERLADSLRVVDSLRRVDSILVARKTWFVARPRDFSQSPALASRVRARLELEFKRTGRVLVSELPDTFGQFSGTWTLARASGAGHLLYTAIQPRIDGTRDLQAWVFDLSSGLKTDSVKYLLESEAPRETDHLAHAVVSRFLPGSADSSCRHDSTTQANRVWGIAPFPDAKADSLLHAATFDSLVLELRRSDRATWSPIALAASTARGAWDSAAAAQGIARLIVPHLSRMPDSTLVLTLRVESTTDSTRIDSVRVLDTDPTRLARRAARLLLPKPASCGPTCGAPSGRRVWSVVVLSDSIRRPAAAELSRRTALAFRDAGDHQYLSLPSKAATLDSARLDSLAKSQGIDVLIRARLAGSDSSWTLAAATPNRNWSLHRGGWRPRVFDWFARKLAQDADSACTGTCRRDSAERRTRTWAIAPTRALDSALMPLVADRMADDFLAAKSGRLLTLPDSLPCTDFPCMDSVAASRGIGNLVVPNFGALSDSTWVLAGWVREPASHAWIDSFLVTGKGPALSAIPKMTWEFWRGLDPAIVCDSCRSLDTLEAGLAVAPPKVVGFSDTIKNRFRDSLEAVLARDGHYQILSHQEVDQRVWEGCDATCRSRALCRLGASFLVTTEISLEKQGWKISASLLDIRTGNVVATMASQDNRSDLVRLSELAPWAARRLLGTSTATVAPTRTPGAPWGKIAALAIPLAIGTGSVIAHW